MITQRFQELVTTISYKKGIPNMRITYTPHPITDRPADLCRKYVAGSDPLTGRPMLEEIYAGLTKPLSAEDRAGYPQYMCVLKWVTACLIPLTRSPMRFILSAMVCLSSPNR